MKYKYQLHTHTTPTSKCSRMTPKELAEALHNAGYAGCVVTNHFMNGNTGVSRELSWEDFVAAYERDYLECKAEGEKYGLDILFGIEEGVGGASEILCYGVTPKMLSEHPELRRCNSELWSSVMHELGVLVINAHPYRVTRLDANPKPLPLERIDGIELYNYWNQPEYNEKAEAFAKEHPGLILTSGGDTHEPETVGCGGIATDERLSDIEKLCEILRSGNYQLLKP